MIGRFSHLGAYQDLLQSREFLRAVTAGGLALAGYLWDYGNTAPTITSLVLALASVTINGFPIIWGALTGILKRRVNVDELVSLAIVASLVQGEVLTAAVVSFVMVVGSLIEQATSNSARRAIQSLISIAPETTTVLVAGEPIIKSIKDVGVGDVLLVKPGDRIPVDAAIIKGTSAIDESAMTGEPIPKDKTVGDHLFAGTLNLSGVLQITATRVGADTTLGRVVRLVSEAEAHKPEAVKLMDRYARWFTPLILACSAMAWGLTGEVGRAVTVLIVGCPCALILAAPTAIVATIGRAAKAGILVKGGQYLEGAGQAAVVFFDKTGTLTEGKPRVNEVVTAAGVNREDVLTLAASIEQNSTHPLARAVLKAAHYAKVSLCEAEEVCTQIGFSLRGRVQGSLIEVGSARFAETAVSTPMELSRALAAIKKRGTTPLMVYRDARPLGVLDVADRIRPTARATIKRLLAMGIEQVGVLSGDHENSASLVAEAVGATGVWSEMKPEDKPRVIKEYQACGKLVLFVGDGINDAPALATADVGIAMGAAGTDVALETADIALMHDDISKLPFLIHLSRRMLKVIKSNIAFGMLFNIAAVAASGSGLLTPIMGALVHNIGSVFVVLSSASMAFVWEQPLSMSPPEPAA